MHPMIVTELAAARRADLLRDVESHRRARLARGARPNSRPARPLFPKVTTAGRLFRIRGGLLFGQRSRHQSAAEACCA